MSEELIISFVQASMRPPPEGGGYDTKDVEIWAKLVASMRPPPEGGGYLYAAGVIRKQGFSFNEAAARGRRISAPPSPGHNFPFRFNEAAARGRRICLMISSLISLIVPLQ